MSALGTPMTQEELKMVMKAQHSLEQFWDDLVIIQHVFNALEQHYNQDTERGQMYHELDAEWAAEAKLLEEKLSFYSNTLATEFNTQKNHEKHVQDMRKAGMLGLTPRKP